MKQVTKVGETARQSLLDYRSRAVRLNVHPRPRNLRESTEVLRVLQRYGRVEMFKNLMYDKDAGAPNTILAIYEQKQGAAKLLAASPLRFSIAAQEQQDFQPILEEKVDDWNRAVEDVAENDIEHTLDDEPVQATQFEPSENSRPESNSDQPCHTQPETFKASSSQSVWGQTFARPSASESIPPQRPRAPVDATSFLSSTTKSDPSPPPPRHQFAATATTSPAVSSSASTPVPQATQTFTLTTTPSHLSHPTFIARQTYYGPYRPKHFWPYSPYTMGGWTESFVGVPKLSRIRRRMLEEFEARGSLSSIWQRGMQRAQEEAAASGQNQAEGGEKEEEVEKGSGVEKGDG